MTEKKCYQVIPGTFVKIFDMGVLIQGESLSGKSTLALMLVEKGHGFIADDCVKFSLLGEKIWGTSPVQDIYPIEIKPYGIINMKNFLSEAIVKEYPLDFVVNLDEEKRKSFSLFTKEIPTYSLLKKTKKNWVAHIEKLARLQLKSRKNDA